MNAQSWTQIRDWLLLGVIVVISIGMMTYTNSSMMRGVRALTLGATAQIESVFEEAGRYLRALEENASLRRQNMQLSSQVARMREAQRQNERLRELLNLQQRAEYPMVSAQIVSKDITQQRNFCVLDVGRVDSVRDGMPVVTPDGILGMVVLTSDHYSVVQTYLNTEFRISAMIEPTQSVGIVRWEGSNPNQLLMEHVVRTENVRPGQRVLTSGYSNVYPRGLPIGRIDSVATRPGRNELLVYLTPQAPLHQAHHAFVLLRETERGYDQLIQQMEQQ